MFIQELTEYGVQPYFFQNVNDLIAYLSYLFKTRPGLLN